MGAERRKDQHYQLEIEGGKCDSNGSILAAKLCKVGQMVSHNADEEKNFRFHWVLLHDSTNMLPSAESVG